MAKKWLYDSKSREYKQYCYVCLQYQDQSKFHSAANTVCIECNAKRNKLKRHRHKTTREEAARCQENKRIKETISKLKGNKE